MSQMWAKCGPNVGQMWAKCGPNVGRSNRTMPKSGPSLDDILPAKLQLIILLDCQNVAVFELWIRLFTGDYLVVIEAIA